MDKLQVQQPADKVPKVEEAELPMDPKEEPMDAEAPNNQAEHDNTAIVEPMAIPDPGTPENQDQNIKDEVMDAEVPENPTEQDPAPKKEPMESVLELIVQTEVVALRTDIDRFIGKLLNRDSDLHDGAIQNTKQTRNFIQRLDISFSTRAPPSVKISTCGVSVQFVSMPGAGVSIIKKQDGELAGNHPTGFKSVTQGAMALLEFIGSKFRFGTTRIQFGDFDPEHSPRHFKIHSENIEMSGPIKVTWDWRHWFKRETHSKHEEEDNSLFVIDEKMRTAESILITSEIEITARELLALQGRDILLERVIISEADLVKYRMGLESGNTPFNFTVSAAQYRGQRLRITKGRISQDPRDYVKSVVSENQMQRLAKSRRQDKKLQASRTVVHGPAEMPKHEETVNPQLDAPRPIITSKSFMKSSRGRIVRHQKLHVAEDGTEMLVDIPVL